MLYAFMGSRCHSHSSGDKCETQRDKPNWTQAMQHYLVLFPPTKQCPGLTQDQMRRLGCHWNNCWSILLLGDNKKLGKCPQTSLTTEDLHALALTWVVGHSHPVYEEHITHLLQGPACSQGQQTLPEQCTTFHFPYQSWEQVEVQIKAAWFPLIVQDLDWLFALQTAATGFPAGGCGRLFL